jgi:hypothetical protein
MTSQQYEELCRFFIARELKIPIARVVSRMIANPRREPGPDEISGEPYKHQLDLYWETEDRLARYVNIANAKWRSHECVHQHEVLLLQKVREKVAAHKAYMITNTDFTDRALQVAEDEGISLLIVRPDFDSSGLHPTQRPLIIEEIQKLAKRTDHLYQYEMSHKGCGMITPDSRTWLNVVDGLERPPPDMDRDSLQRANLLRNLMGLPLLPIPYALPGGLPSPPSAPPPGLGGYATRQGGGPEFRTK